MARPIKPRRLCANPSTFYFKPQGIPLRFLEEEVLKCDEFEALKLCDVDGLSQTEAAKKMRVSQPTLARILARVHRKIACAIIYGKAIKIDKNLSK